MPTENDQAAQIEMVAQLFANNVADHSIDLDEAAELTANYRDANSTVPDLTLGGCFSRAIIEDILAQYDSAGNLCSGIRYYSGQDINGTPQLVLVGVDANGDDLYEGTLAERARLSPPSWPSANPLNGL